MSRPRGRVVAGWCGRAVVVVVVVWAIGLPLLSGARPDLFRVVWTVLICAFLWQGATAAIAAGQSLGVLARLVLRLHPSPQVTATVAASCERPAMADLARRVADSPVEATAVPARSAADRASAACRWSAVR